MSTREGKRSEPVVVSDERHSWTTNPDPTPRTAATAREALATIRASLQREYDSVSGGDRPPYYANGILYALMVIDKYATPEVLAAAEAERTHWDGTVLLGERNHYLAGCPCPQGPWCVPHGWSGPGAEHHAICADHEHVAAPAPTPSEPVGRCVRGVYAVHAGIPTVVTCGEPHDAETHEQGAPDYDHPFTPGARDE